MVEGRITMISSKTSTQYLTRKRPKWKGKAMKGRAADKKGKK